MRRRRCRPERLAAPAQRLDVEAVEVGLAGGSALGEGHRRCQALRGDMPIGRAVRDMIGPAVAAGSVEQDALEAVIVANREPARGGPPRQDLARELEPAAFEASAVIARHREAYGGGRARCQ